MDYKIITLCGSTKFKDKFMEVQKRLTLEGNIVMSLGLFGHSGDSEIWKGNTKEMLNDMQKTKIAMSNAIFVINVDGYIGNNTKSQIEYALSIDKEVLYLEEVEEKVLEGMIKFYGKEARVKVEIKNNEIIMHFPEGTDTSNWNHAIGIYCDL